MIVLGIETSCDETSASVVRDGREILSNIIHSQIIHAQYGGVVPELAARDHLNRISQVVSEAISKAGLKKEQVDLLAATNRPGLAGALLVGYSYAQGLALSLAKPLIPVNHVAAHIYAAFIGNPGIRLPLAALAVSGGHTSLFHMDEDHNISLMGQTLDDAAGEAFDKAAKMMGLGYPGGPNIECLALKNSEEPVKFPRALLGPDSLDFSFSGLKTAVLNHLQGIGQKGPVHENIPAVCAGFQDAVFDVLIEKLRRASNRAGCRTLAVVGGVAANRTFRQRLESFGIAEGKDIIVPEPQLCTDNGAMIACCGYYLFTKHKELEHHVSARSNWPEYRHT